VYGESRPAVWYGEPVTRERAPPRMRHGEPPHTGRGRSATNKGAPSHARATPHGGHATHSRPPRHARRGGPPCHAKGSQSHEWGSPLSCEWAVPVVWCKAHSRMPRHAWGEPLVWGAKPHTYGCAFRTSVRVQSPPCVKPPAPHVQRVQPSFECLDFGVRVLKGAIPC